MTRLEKTTLHEIATLPESRRPDVLAFVCYLKLSIPNEKMELQISSIVPNSKSPREKSLSQSIACSKTPNSSHRSIRGVQPGMIHPITNFSKPEWKERLITL